MRDALAKRLPAGSVTLLLDNSLPFAHAEPGAAPVVHGRAAAGHERGHLRQPAPRAHAEQQRGRGRRRAAHVWRRAARGAAAQAPEDRQPAGEFPAYSL